MSTNASPNASSSVDEIRSFLSEMQEKSPEEVLGLPTKSHLPNLTILSALATLVLLVVTTSGMYCVNLIRGELSPQTPAVATPADAAQGSATPATDDSASSATAAATQPAEPGDASAEAADPDAAIQAMGIGESKEADADANSLESGIDDLLKGLE